MTADPPRFTRAYSSTLAPPPAPAFYPRLQLDPRFTRAYSSTRAPSPAPAST